MTTFGDPDAGPVDAIALGGDAVLPFACRHEDGTGSIDTVVKPRAIQCALSRVCGVCARPLTRPVAFVGSTDNADDNTFAFPPCHPQCALDLARPGLAAEIVTTGGFDMIRPSRRGGPVAFRPNSVIDRSPVMPAI